MAESPDDGQLQISRNIETEKATGLVSQVQDKECLEAERILKALLSIDAVKENDNDPKPKALVDYSESNSDDPATQSTIPEVKKKRRRRQRIRTRKRKAKAIQPEDTCDHSTTDPDAKSTTDPEAKSTTSSCTSCNECAAEIVQETGDDLIIVVKEESDSAISQDETYQDLITEHYILDFEERMIKENLFVEHEKLAKEVAAFESKLTAQQEKSEAMERSLKELESDNGLLQREKTELLDDVKRKEDEISVLIEQATSLKTTCDKLSERKDNEVKAWYIELDNLKSQVMTKEDELEFVKRKNENEYKELAKNHGLFLAKILSAAQEVNSTLYTRNFAKFKPEVRKTNNVLQLLKQLKQDAEALSDKSSALEITVKQLRDDIESQTKTLTKVTNDKKQLKDEVVEVNKQNKALVKEKAKLVRDKEALRTEAVRAKNTSQTYKVRLDELKANYRSAKRENEIVSREKQNIEMTLKNHGVDYKALLLKQNAKNTEKNALDLVLDNGQRDLETDSIKTGEDPSSLNGDKDLKQPKQTVKNRGQNSEESKDNDASFHPKPNGETITDVREALEKLREENNLLKLEREKQQKSLDNYKELIRGYSHMINRAQEERVVGVREMRCINRELERYGTLLEEQKEGAGTQLVGVHEGINLIHAMYQRLKSFAGKLMNTDLLTSIASSDCSETIEPTSFKVLELTNERLKEKLAESDHNISLLKVNLDAKRTQATEVQTQIHETLFGNEQRPAVEPPEQKSCKKAKRNGLLSFTKRKNENDGLAGKAESNSKLLSEKQLAVVIDLVQVKEQLVIGIRESIDLEERLDSLAKESREYMDILQSKDHSFDENTTASKSFDFEVDAEENLEVLKCLKEKDRAENEFAFKEAHVRLLEKQIGLLKSERKACLRALRRYEEEMKGFVPNAMVSALARLLSSSATSEKSGKSDFKEERTTSNENVANGSNDGTLNKSSMLGHGTKSKAAVTGSNV